MQHDQQLMDTTAAAAILNIKPSTMHVWRSYGKGPAYLKIGRVVRYRMSDLVAYMDDSVKHCTSE